MENKTFRHVLYICITILLLFTGTACQKEPVEEENEEVIINPEADEREYILEAVDDGDIIFYASDDYYRYGPSIMKNEDGSYDAWFSSPGNSGSQWDWITYRHSDDGKNWSDETVVLKPTPGSKDQCSVCDPGVIYFGGYYYLAYTATDYYEGKGSYNMAFVARSKHPDGPFEKWNGSSWGGDPEPIIFYDGGKDNWGIGEVSFVILQEDLYIYYSYIDIADSYIGLYKADLIEDWPSSIRQKGPVLYRQDHDSVEVVYDEHFNTFFAFTMEGRLTEGSFLSVYESSNGKDFVKKMELKNMIEDYSHNLGVSKSPSGHIDTDKDILIGYAYGKDWGKWNTRFQRVRIS